MNNWKIVKYRPCDVQMNHSEKPEIGLFRLEEGGGIGRIFAPHVDNDRTSGGLHRFNYRGVAITTLCEFSPEALMELSSGLMKQLNDKLKELELPTVAQLLEMLSNETLDLNNELSDTEMEELIPYSDLRKMMIKNQIFTNHIVQLLESFKDKEPTKEEKSKDGRKNETVKNDSPESSPSWLNHITGTITANGGSYAPSYTELGIDFHKAIVQEQYKKVKANKSGEDPSVRRKGGNIKSTDGFRPTNFFISESENTAESTQPIAEPEEGTNI